MSNTHCWLKRLTVSHVFTSAGGDWKFRWTDMSTCCWSMEFLCLVSRCRSSSFMTRTVQTHRILVNVWNKCEQHSPRVHVTSVPVFSWPRCRWWNHALRSHCWGQSWRTSSVWAWRSVGVALCLRVRGCLLSWRSMNEWKQMVVRVRKEKSVVVELKWAK